jgi:hypothetical protein
VRAAAGTAERAAAIVDDSLSHSVDFFFRFPTHGLERDFSSARASRPSLCRTRNGYALSGGEKIIFGLRLAVYFQLSVALQFSAFLLSS